MRLWRSFASLAIVSLALGAAAFGQSGQFTVKGKVTDLTTGAAVPGLRMMVLVTTSAARKTVQATTDKTGAYSVSVPKGATVVCYFMPDGSGGGRSYILDEEWWQTWRPASVKVTKDTTLNHKIKLVAMRAIALTVTDKAGAPAAGALILAGKTSAKAATDGKAVVRVAKDAKTVDVLVVSAKQDCGAYVKIEAQEKAVAVTLAPPAAISGSIICSDGKPGAGITLQAMPVVGDQPAYQVYSGAGATTDERGRFEVKGYPGPAYMLYWDKSEGFKRGQATVTFADKTMLSPATAEAAVYDPEMFKGSVCRSPETKVKQASCFALDADDNILVCDEAGSRVLKVSPDDKLLATYKLDFQPQSIDVGKDGSILVGGTGNVAILDGEGKVKVSGTVPGKRTVAAVAHGGDDVFVCASGDAGFAVYRMKDDLKTPKKVIASLSGCCGQMDIRAHGGFIYAAENTRFSIGKYNLEGKKVADFVHSDSKKDDYYGEGCCEPKNICFGPDGTIYTAASGQMEIKRYTADGKYLGLVGKLPDADGSCVRVTLGVSKDGSRVYVLDTSNNAVRLLKQTSQ